jgi:Bacterial Ig domain
MFQPRLGVLLLGLTLSTLGCSETFFGPDDCVTRGNNYGTDRTPPTVSFVQPAANATLAGAVVLTATATDNCGISAIRFAILGGAPLGDGSRGGDGRTYTLHWDTRAIENGTLTIAVYADDTHLDLDGSPTPNTGFDSRLVSIVNR